MDPVQAANILFGIWQMLANAPQDSPAPDPASDVSTAQEAARDAFERDRDAFEERTDRLVLVVHAMWTLIVEKMGITEADLVKRIADLDAADGAVDGRAMLPSTRCTCGAMVCRKLQRCLFCGKAYPDGTFEAL